MDFCFCFTPLRIKHTISCLDTWRSYVETKILESGGQEILETRDIPILVAQFSPHLLFVAPSLCVQYDRQLQLNALGNKQPNTRDQFQGAQPANRAGPTCSRRVSRAYQC